MKVLVLNGPNINLLGLREPEIYGSETYADLLALLQRSAEELGIDLEHFQSNYEGALVEKIQSAYGRFDAIVINAAAYTHTSIAILDALRAVALPAVEVHISDVSAREPFRRLSYCGCYCEKSIIGHGLLGYRQALQYLIQTYG